MSLRISVVIAAAICAPRLAHGQFAGVITAPPRRAAAVALTPERERAVHDSTRTAILSEMRAWVDSAAGIVTVTPRAPDAPGTDRTTRADTARVRPAPPPRTPRR